MNFSIKDRSNYLKGLLIIAKKDKQLAESEKSIIRQIAEKLGFAEDFYEDTLRSLLANKYIIDDPISFSDQKVAESFVKDGLRLAYSDNQVSDVEINWLRLTAEANNISETWFKEKESVYNNPSSQFIGSDLALYSII